MKAKFLFLSVLFVVFCASCSVYHPQTVDIPLLREKNEAKLDATFSVSGIGIPTSIGANVTASYAINHWFAVQAFANYDMRNEIYLHGALGAYKPFKHSVLEGFVGYGYGHANLSRTSKSGSNTYQHFTTGHYNLCFGQLEYGFTNLTKAHIDCGIGFKIGYFIPNVTFSKYQYISDNTDYLHDETPISPNKDFKTPFLYYEPQVFIRLGGEKFKVNLKMGMDFSSYSSVYELMDMFSVGVGFTIEL